VVLKYLDEAISELDNMGSLVSSYKIHLNVSSIYIPRSICDRTVLQAVSDDISYIQSQNRGLQVQTQNQRVLLGELENLLVRLTAFYYSFPIAHEMHLPANCAS
jgi:hypothetical protein